MKTRSRKRRVLRWAVRITLGLIALCVLAIGIAIGAIHTSWGRDYIRRRIVAELQADFPGSKIGALEGSPFGTIVLRGVEIHGRDHKPLVTVDRIDASVELSRLVHHEVIVDELVVKGVHVFIHEQPPEPAKPAAPAAGPGEPSRWSISVPVIAVDDAQVDIETASGHERVDAITVRAGAWLPAGKPLVASASVRARFRGKDATLLAVVEQEGPAIRVPMFAAGYDGARAVGYDLSVGEGLTVSGNLDVRNEDVEASVQAKANGQVHVAAASARGRVEADLVADLANKRAKGVISAFAPEGTAVAAIDADGVAQRVRGVVSFVGQAAGAPPTSGIAVIDGTPAGIDIATSLRAGALRDMIGGGAAMIVARIDLDESRTHATLAKATISATARNPKDIRGTIASELTAHGALWPEPELAVRGAIEAQGVRRADLSLGSARAELDAHVRRDGATADVTASVSRVRSGTTRIPAATLTASMAVAATGNVEVELGAHRVTTADGRVWSGRGGHVTVTQDAIAVDGVETRTGTSAVGVTARVTRASGDLDARLRARRVSLAIADPQLKGNVDAEVSLDRRSGRWNGTATVHAHAVGVPDRPVVDATLGLKVAGRKIRIDANVDNPEVGHAELAAAVTGPRDITDVVAWRQLPRAALETITLSLDVDGKAVGASGRATGELALTATETHGSIHVTGVDTKHGMANAELDLSAADNGAIRSHATGQLEGLPTIVADATVDPPAHLFDPQAWQHLGSRAVLDVSAHVPGIDVDPALLERFGVTADVRGHVAASLVGDPTTRSATLTLELNGVRGGSLKKPINGRVTATTSPSGTSAAVTATAGAVKLTLDSKTPLSVEAALAYLAAHPGTLPDSPIDVTLDVPTVTARDLLAVLGRTDALAGSVGGHVEVGGTLRDPTLHATVGAANVAVASTLSGKKPPTLDSLGIDARLEHGHAHITISGKEAGGGVLEITGDGERARKTVVASLQAANFDLAPLAAFAPGALRGGRGTLSGMLSIHGLDPQTGDVRGVLQIRDGRMPLSPELGSLRRASIEVNVMGRDVVAKFDGKVGTGGGSMNATVKAHLEGGVPTKATLDAVVDKVQTIGVLQPQISAEVHGDFATDGQHWNGKMTVSNGNIVVPEETGTELLGTGAPADMIFVETTPLVKKLRHPPTKPWLTTRVVIGPTKLDVDDKDVRIQLIAKGQLRIEVGDGIGMTGTIRTQQGNVDVVGRRYRLEQALVDFDGPDMFDPRLDIRMVHDFKNLSLAVDITGRSTAPDLRFAGDPGSYTQGQLLSFLMGAEPGNDDSSVAQTNDAVVGGSLAIATSRIGRSINKHLNATIGKHIPIPIELDALNYEAESASSSRAVRFGLRLSERAHLLWRQHFEARPDENPGEGVFDYQLRSNTLFELTAGERASGGDLMLQTRW